MQEREENQDTQNLVEQVVAENTASKMEVKRKAPKWWMVLIAVLLGCFCTYFAFKNLGLFQRLGLTEEEIEEDTQQEEIETEEKLTLFTGDTISAQLPLGWSIVEYYDGEGTEHIAKEYGDFTGLTGIKIFKGDTEVFYLQAIYGIGFTGCPIYTKFEDDNPDYYAEILEDNELAGDTTEIVDYSDSEYTEFVWLGKTFRRIDKIYNYDTVEGNEFFEPSCIASIVSFDSLKYFPPSGPSADSYDYGSTNDVTVDDLLIIDGILESMSVI